jgi:hypothetical protein
MRLELVPLRVRDRHIEHRVEGAPLDRGQVLQGIAGIAGVPCGCVHGRQQDSLERAEGRALEIRAALGVDQPPAFGPELLGELVRQP